jgi:hypothetical protein
MHLPHGQSRAVLQPFALVFGVLVQTLVVAVNPLGQVVAVVDFP